MIRQIRRIIFILFIFVGSAVSAQNKQASIWHVGNKKLDFNTNPVTVTDLSYPFQGIHSSIALADENGDYVLFASSQSQKLYDNNYSEIPMGNINFGHLIRGAIFIPFPNNPNLIYFFYKNQYALIDKSNYTLIEKDINWTNKNNLFLYAVQHIDCNNTWLINQRDTGFYSYLISETGISTTPVFSQIQGSRSHIGAFSSSGKYFAVLNSVTQHVKDTVLINFGQFDRQSGELTTTHSYKFTNYDMCYASEFSPDETKLYLFMKKRDKSIHDLYQVNIIDEVPDFENAVIISTQTISGFSTYSSMQLGIDGKIYFTYHFNKKKIDIIHNPNNLGVACNYQDNAIPLTTTQNSLPTFISTWLSPNPCELDFSYLADCSLKKAFTINNTTNIQSVLWDFGDGTTSTEQNPIHEYATAGTYTVTLTVTYHDGNTQTITKEIEVFGKPPKLIIEHE